MAITCTCETLPADPKAAIRQIKQELRAQIGDVQAVFDRLTARIAARVEEIDALKTSGQDVWPTIPFADTRASSYPIPAPVRGENGS